MTDRSTPLVLGASGFLGSHVARHLSERSDRVRILVRPTSSLRGVEGLDLDLRHGDVHDPASIRAAMEGVDDVYHCIVDTRAWLRDPAPLWRTNVEALPPVLDAALDAGVRRFVFTSSLVTMGRDERGHPVDETEAHNWLDRGGDYVASRLRAEELVLSYARDRGLPAIAMCVGNTYGTGDHGPTPHGKLLYAAAQGQVPFYVRDATTDVVAIDEAARALVLAAERGRVGERYCITERTMTMQELLTIGADVGGVRRPWLALSPRTIDALGAIGEQVARLVRRDLALTRTTAQLMHVMTPLDSTKARRELGWDPRPTTDAIREAAQEHLDKVAARRRR